MTPALKRQYLERLADAQTPGLWHLVTPAEIRARFPYTRTPVFRIGDRQYAVKTRMSKGLVMLDDLRDGRWRTPWLKHNELERIALDQSFCQQIYPGCYYVVHSIVLNNVPILTVDGELYKLYWRAALVKP